MPRDSRICERQLSGSKARVTWRFWVMKRIGLAVSGRKLTPWKINMEPTNHPFRKEHDLPNLHDYVPMLIFGALCLLWSWVVKFPTSFGAHIHVRQVWDRQANQVFIKYTPRLFPRRKWLTRVKVRSKPSRFSVSSCKVKIQSLHLKTSYGSTSEN